MCQYQLYSNNDKYVLKYHRQPIGLKTASVRNIMPVLVQNFYIALNFYVSASRDIFLIAGLHSLTNLQPMLLV